MKKERKTKAAVIILAVFLICTSTCITVLLGLKREADEKSDEQQAFIENQQAELEELKTPHDGVKYNGSISVLGTELINEQGKTIQLRGISSHGIQWYPEYTNYRSIKSMREYGANAFRIAVYTDGNSGYIENTKGLKDAMYMALENTLGADMYAIVDWHILEDSDPNINSHEATVFFDEVSSRYADEAGVIYEICNEPNGDTDWEDVTAYAEKVIPVIRKNSPNSLIIVGTPKYCTDLKGPGENPLPYDNIVYAYHYYTGADNQDEKNMLDYALERGLPVFVSEWGFKSGKEDQKDANNFADDFLNYLNKRSISWVYWALSNKDEIHSIIKPDCDSLSGWDESSLSETGKYIVRKLGE